MPFVISTEDVAVNDNETRQLWRLLTPETMGDDLGAVAGIVGYKYRSPESSPNDEELGGAHGQAEFYYVLSGEGVVGEPGGIRSTIKTGSTFVIRAGTPHSIWSITPGEQVVTFYVALKK